MAMQSSTGGRYSYSTTGTQAPPTYNPSAAASSFVQQPQQPQYSQQPQPQQYTSQPQQQYGQQQQPQQARQYASQPPQQYAPAAVPGPAPPVIRHHRRAPPPPANFVPPSGQAPAQQQAPPAQQQPRPAYPQQPAQQPYSGQPQPAAQQRQPQASPQYARQQQPQQPQQPQQLQQPQQQPQQAAGAGPAPAGQPPAGEQPKGWVGAVTTTVTSWWGKDKRQQQRDDLMAGATAKPVYTTSAQPAAVGATWEEVQSNPEMRQQQYAALQLDNSATQLALQKAREAQGIGMATMDSLARQGEMIDTVSTNVETIHLQLDRGDRQMRSIQGVTGSLSNFVTPDKAEKQNKMVYNMANNKVDRTLTPVLQEVPPGGSPQGTRYGSHHMASAPATLKDQIAEQDAALDELSSMLGNLQSIARTTGTELDRQNQQLDTVNVRTQHAMQRTHDTNYRLQRMM